LDKGGLVIKHHAMKEYGGVAVEFLAFSSCVVVVNELSASPFGHFRPKKRTHCIIE
jgi:hypothetical protein